MSSAGAVNSVYGSADGLHSGVGLTSYYRERADQVWHQNSTGIEQDAEADDRLGTLR